MQRIHKTLAELPFLGLNGALVVLRLTVAGLFGAHAIVRIANGSIPQFGGFMEKLGFPHGIIWVWGITATELVAGTLLILGRLVRPACLALFTIAFVGIILIHRHFGWFVGEHGIGGSEYSVALIAMLLVVAAADRERSQQ